MSADVTPKQGQRLAMLRPFFQDFHVEVVKGDWALAKALVVFKCWLTEPYFSESNSKPCGHGFAE